MELFIAAFILTFIFGSFSFMLLKNTDGVLTVSSFSKKFAESPKVRIFIKVMGWWFLILVIGVWIIAIVSLFE